MQAIARQLALHTLTPHTLHALIARVQNWCKFVCVTEARFRKQLPQWHRMLQLAYSLPLFTALHIKQPAQRT